MKMMYLVLIALFGQVSGAQAQKFFTREGKVSFFSSAPMEKIEAFNRQATAVVDLSSGAMEFAVLIKAFQFEKALMQEHFNENYMESTKYPKATFKGSVVEPSRINLQKDGVYSVVVKGKLTIKDVTKDVETEGVFTVSKGLLSATAGFRVAVADYHIEIPKLVAEKIAKIVDVKVDVALAPLAK
jgi:polyisoprenoid-binding protein YceI